MAFEKGGFPPALQREWHAALDARDRARFGAWGPWRSNLALGRFVPCIRDPDNNVILELDKKGWAARRVWDRTASFSDFICPDDPIVPGPLAAIGEKLRPVFFVKNAFERALAAVSRPVRRRSERRGRRPVYDREQVARIVFEQMDYHGEFAPSDLQWRAQADLERAVMEGLGSNPAESTVRNLIKKPLEAWRRQYCPANN